MKQHPRFIPALLAFLALIGFAVTPATAQSSFYKDKWGVNDDSGIRTWLPYGPGAFARASEAGFSWVRYGFYWNNLNPNPDDPATPQLEGFEWASSDTAINDIAGQGLQIYGNIMWAPDWAAGGTPGYQPFNCMDPETITFVPTNHGCGDLHPDVDALKKFVREAVLRYGSRIRYWGFWNEPNYQIFWHSSTDYTQNLHDVVDYVIIPAAEAARAANPNVLIVGPDTDDPEALRIILARDQQYFVDSGYQQRLFDVISFHQYAPDTSTIPGGDMSQIGTLIDRYNAPAVLGTYRAERPVWMTESYASKDSVEQLLRAIDQRPWIDRFAYYGFKALNCKTPGSDPACNTWTTSGTPTPTYMLDLLNIRLPPFYAAKRYLRGAQIFTDQTPDTTGNAAPGYEVATQFSSTQNGMIKALRFWRAPGESGNNTLRLWTDTGVQLAAATLVNNGASGWQEAAIAPVQIQAGTRYRVSVNTNTAQSKTGCGIGSGITSGPLTAHSGYWGQPMGAMPTNGSCGNFFVDVTFEPGVRIFTTQTPGTTSGAAPGYEVATQFSADRNGTVKALRFWRAAGETGNTVVRLWTDSGQLLASATYRDYGTGSSGWQQLAIPAVPITANTRYRVSFNTNTMQAKTACGIGSGITKGPLTAWQGYWGQPIGNMPTNGSCSNFFADVVFDW